jgi:hypothetical protein
MTSAIEYRAKAAKLRELAAQATDPVSAEIYAALARDYEAAATELEQRDANESGSAAPPPRASKAPNGTHRRRPGSS